MRSNSAINNRPTKNVRSRIYEDPIYSRNENSSVRKSANNRPLPVESISVDERSLFMSEATRKLIYELKK